MKGHEYFGYTKHGDYRCECGAIIGAKGPLKADDVNVLLLKDAWNRHRQNRKN